RRRQRALGRGGMRFDLKSSSRSAWFLVLACLGLCVAMQLFPALAWARPGGGESYSGGGGGGGSSGGGGGGADIGLLIDLVILCIHYPALGVPLLVIALFFI